MPRHSVWNNRVSLIFCLIPGPEKRAYVRQDQPFVGNWGFGSGHYLLLALVSGFGCAKGVQFQSGPQAWYLLVWFGQQNLW